MAWKRVHRALGALVVGGGLGAGVLALSASPASASYGPGTAYQVEISGNTNNLTAIGGRANGSGGGFWFWAALTPTSASGGAVDYQETDCVHNVAGAANGAVHNGGETTYTLNGNGTLTINGVASGLGLVDITVPATYGHYGPASVSFPPFSPLLTDIQAQVAP